jgi:hypothetical protein
MESKIDSTATHLNYTLDSTALFYGQDPPPIIGLHLSSSPQAPLRCLIRALGLPLMVLPHVLAENTVLCTLPALVLQKLAHLDLPSFEAALVVESNLRT